MEICEHCGAGYDILSFKEDTRVSNGRFNAGAKFKDEEYLCDKCSEKSLEQ